MIIRTLDFDLGSIISGLGTAVVIFFFLMVVLSMAVRIVPEQRCFIKACTGSDLKSTSNVSELI